MMDFKQFSKQLGLVTRFLNLSGLKESDVFYAHNTYMMFEQDRFIETEGTYFLQVSKCLYFVYFYVRKCNLVNTCR